jgi:hypothetical protein
MRVLMQMMLLLLLVLVLSPSLSWAEDDSEYGHENGPNVDDEDEDDDDEYRHHSEDETSVPSGQEQTDHELILQDTFVDFSSADLTGDASSAAKNAVDILASHFLSEGRLQELFEKTKTPECRALIAEHFGYHVMAVAKEEPLPFEDIRFENTCEDERPFDFDNLPEGVHMGVSCMDLVLQYYDFVIERNLSTICYVPVLLL